MIFARMDLRFQVNDSRFASSDDDEQIFGYEAHSFTSFDDFNVGQPLAIRADGILAFDNEYALAP